MQNNIVRNCKNGESKKKVLTLSARVWDIILSSDSRNIASLTVKKLACKLDVSVPYLSSVFKQQAGINLKEALLKQKMVLSGILLAQNSENTELTIKEIAKFLGFCSTDYVIRIFKDFYGATPGKYRNTARRLKKSDGGSTSTGQKDGERVPRQKQAFL